jgi:hypothetical protein
MRVKDKQEETKLSGTKKFWVYVENLKYRAEKHMASNK